MRPLLLGLGVAGLILVGCSGSDETLVVTSSAFESGGRIPQKYTAEGENISPPLSWAGAPEGTIEFAVICDDPDAPTPKPWVHWVLFNIPAGVTSLGENDTGGGVPGLSGGQIQYYGPRPPIGHGVHHYHFKVYALDKPMSLDMGASKDQLLEAMERHILAKGELVGTYER
jgi:Raf kinase inhibitor-like YbhB/YbcL family protein